MSDKPQTYREWELANWQESADYRRAERLVGGLMVQIADLEKSISEAERGEIPESHRAFFGPHDKSFGFGHVIDTQAIQDSIMAHVSGNTVTDVRSERWAREAIEAEGRRNDKLEFWLTLYRDGKFKLFSINNDNADPEPGSLPYCKKELIEAQGKLQQYIPLQSFDWHQTDDDDWYDKSQKVLGDMLSCLGWETPYEFNEMLMNFIQDMAEKYDFRFATWVGDFGFTTCSLSNSQIKARPVVRRDFEPWSAILRALLDFIDTHWIALRSIAD